MPNQNDYKHYWHGLRVAAAGLMALAFFVSQLHFPLSLTRSQQSVLGYATNVSRLGLLDDTNQERVKNHESILHENSKLDASAQAKAEQMAKNNYWSHVAPDGTQPWTFFDKAGYQYLKAGENLAYGFSTSDSTVTAWMNSPTHRANLLGDYKDVGFGIANGADYQGGNYTIVVAHYGLAASQASVASAKVTTPSEPISTGPTTQINMWQQLSSGNVSALAVASLSICLGAMLMFAYAHRQLLAHAVVRGEKLAMRHPLIDVSFMFIVMIAVLMSRVGSIS